MGKEVVNHKLAAALDLASRLEQTPELIIDSQQAKAHIKALADALNASQCYVKAQLKGREVFCLTSDDRLAPDAINLWAYQAQQAGLSGPRVDGAVEMALRWRINPDARLPD